MEPSNSKLLWCAYRPKMVGCQTRIANTPVGPWRFISQGYVSVKATHFLEIG